MVENIDAFDILSPLASGAECSLCGGQGALLTTETGETLVDLNEMRVVLGQRNEAFLRAMENAFSGFTAPKDGHSPQKQRLLRYLYDTTGGAFSGCFFASSGSEAVEWAVRLAKKITGKEELLSFYNSIHGRTYLSASMSGLPKRKTGYGPLAPGVVLLPYPATSKCPAGMSEEEYGDLCLNRAKEIYRYGSAQRAAALIVELCQGAGVVRPPKGYLKKLRQWTKEQGILLIADEIQTGIGRTGTMYLCEQEELDPDMLLLGKALGNGLHIAALLVKNLPQEENLYALSGGSGDDPVACAAACEVFRQLQDGLLTHVKTVGDCLNLGLASLAYCSCVRETRGAGLMAAVEFTSPEVCERVFESVRKAGYLPGHGGSVLFCKPPYVITEHQIEGFLTALKEAIAAEEDL